MILLAGCLMFLSSGVLANEAKQAAVLLQEGRYADEIDGNLDKAIGIYEQIIQDAGADGSIKAQAMYLQGMCYSKKGDEGKAQDVLSKLVAQYPQQTKLIEKVQATLQELSDSDPAALMPPETLVYVELGSPGKQIETILDMLKGTPLENPLAAMYDASRASVQAEPPVQLGRGGETQMQGVKVQVGQNGQTQVQQMPQMGMPGNIINSIFNPSMMTELKKIRGLAVGVTEIKNNPPAVVVLYPGKSDALRGLVMAGLGMIGQPAEDIDGMKILSIQNQAGAAYDDNVIIVAEPMDMLKKTISLYKRKGGPNLAENNKSFAEIGKAVRKQNVLTVWAKVDKVFEGIKKTVGEDSEEMKMVEVFMEPQNIDEFVASISLNSDSISYNDKMSFKAGYQGLAYNLCRTSNLTKDGFSNVPSEAVALISIALSPSTGEKLQKPLQNITGMDFGREIFNNIEQINIYAVPVTLTPGKGDSPVAIAECAGIAITSRNPAQTQQILRKILGLANVVSQLSSWQNKEEKPDSQADKYMIAEVDGQKLYCYLGQNEKTTIVTFSPELMKISMAAKDNSVLKSGPLQGAVSSLNPDTSKLVLINAGGLIKIVEAFLKMKNDNADNPGYKQVEQIAALCDKTNIYIRSEEKDDSAATHAGIERIPQMKDIFPLVMQMSNVNLEQKTEAANPQPADKSAVAASASIKLQWTTGAAAVSHKVYTGSSPEKLTLLTETKENNCELKTPEQAENANYYWRVDEVRADGSVKTGSVWHFYTGGMIAHWKFDETEGTVAKDSTKNHFDAALKGGAKWESSGETGGALSLDGVDGYVELPEGINQFSGGLTVMLWAKPEDNAEWSRFFEFGNGEQKDNIILSRRGDTNDLSFEVYPGIQWVGRVQSAGAIEKNTWQCFAATIDVEGNAVLYRNGKKIQQGRTGGITDVPRKMFYIGKSQWPNDKMYKGMIDDFRIYNYVLGGQEIKGIYKSTLNPALKKSTAGSLAAHWKLDEKEGSVAKDTQGNLDGKIIGQPHWVSGKVDGALEFDGVENYIELPARTSGGAFTITLWAYPTEAGEWARFAEFGNNSDKYADRIFLSRMGTSNNLILHVYAGIGAASWTRGSVEAENAIEQNKWQFFAVTVDNDGTAAIYKDGKLIKEGDSGVPGTNLRNKNYIGKSFTPDDKLYKGMMDDIRIYNNALDDEEIEAIYKSAVKP